MKSNQVSILVVLVLCLAMGGFLYIMDRSSDEAMGWNPSDLYGELGARSYEGSSYSNVTFSGGAASDGIAVSMRNGSFSLRTRARHASSPSSLVANGVPGKSADFWGALSPNSPIASSPNSLIGHMTSSAEFHSFGGGSNVTMGSYTSSSNNLIASSPAIGSYSQLPIANNPITSSPNNLIAYSPSNGEVQVSAEQALMSASSSASGLFGGMMTSYGTASHSDYVGMSGGKPSGVRGRQNAAPGMGDGWWNWLDEWVKENGTKKTSGEGSDAVTRYLVDKEDLQNAYNDFINNYWNSGMGDPPTFEDWWEWYSSTMYGGEYGVFGDGSYYQYGNYLFTPVGDVLPLVLLALMYMIILFVKRNKTAQL